MPPFNLQAVDKVVGESFGQKGFYNIGPLFAQKGMLVSKII